MKWLRRAAFVMVGLLVLAAAAIIVGARAKRSASGPVESMGSGLHHVRNLVTDLYGARVGTEVVLFDAALDPQGRAIDDLLRTLGAKRENVSHVFLSHGHFDHVAGAGLFPRARIHIGAGDAGVLAQSEPARPWLPRLWGALFGVPAVEGGVSLNGRERVDVGGGESVLAIPFPGHTPGSYLFLFRGVLFTGDSVMFDHGKLTPAVPRYSVDIRQNREAVHGLPGLIAGESVDQICTGHMVCSRPGEAATLLTTVTGP
jgi:glyoxylase-like metal-dependent hydrolase (beta-lactamase superfamily II)